jgi:methylase of polypeptide subunit release factors
MTELWSVGQGLSLGRKTLADAGIATAGLDTMLMMMKAAGLTKTELATREQQTLTPSQMTEYQRMLDERAAHKPVQYIINKCEFMGMKGY